ncbi:MAG: 16S rRNA (uracil(1498)-N(3))-methyltransferase [Fibrobacter sp.]|nr:16S rRNA (uracil(1498)-N(3))-methyltransferase [Fibrobacter sp.]
MKSPDTRFYVTELSTGTIPLSDEESAHAVRVCRARPGDVLNLTDGKGHFAKGTVEKADPRECLVHVSSIEASDSEKPKLHLGLACLKDDANEEVALHVSEMEVGSITLLRTEHSEEPKDSNLQKVIRRCELKALVSLKQSLKAWLTEIHGPIPFEEWLKSYNGDIILCDMDGADSLGEISKETTLLVGPEGGFSKKEIELVKAYSRGEVKLLKLGRTRLRARTAAIVGIGKMV